MNHLDEEKFKDGNLFQKNYVKDPFRDDNLVYKTPPERQPPPPIFDEELEEKNVSSIFRHAFKQITVTLVILVLGFIILNWSAYYQIAKNRIQKLIGAEETSPLHELTDTQNETPPTLAEEDSDYTRTLLRTTGSPEAQKKQIPNLNIDVTPIDNRLVIPRIDQNIPIVRVSSENLVNRDWGALESDIQNALRDGVVHYPGTSLPGQNGNVVITGHSSYFPWDPGRFKDVFALLHDVVVGDRLVVYYNQTKYIYEVDDIEVVLPQDVHVLEQSDEEKLTLITCTPVGTNLKRLVVTAKLLSPSPEGYPVDTSSTETTRVLRS